MKKISAIILLVLFVLMVWKIGWVQAFLFYAGALFLLIIGAIFVYALRYRGQKDQEIWEDEP